MNIKKAKEDCIKWMRDWYDSNGKGCNIIIGISGGVDSSVVAALCIEAFGKDKVIGVLMPQWVQTDISYAYGLIDELGIKHMSYNIGETVSNIIEGLEENMPLGVREITSQTKINLPARIRMVILYAIAQSMNGRVANTCNLSEDYIGYSTRWGDSVGDFAPIANFTKTEVKLLGKELNLPDILINKTPADGLCDKTDEENFGFTYDILDTYIRTGICEDKRIKDTIDHMHEKNKFKLKPIPKFEWKEDERVDEKMIAKEMSNVIKKRSYQNYIKDELDSCTKQIKEALGVDVIITLANDKNKTLNKITLDDVDSISREKEVHTGKIRTIINFKDGTRTCVTLNELDDYDDPEKAIMWCLLKKCFKSKRSLEKVIYALNDNI